jgi:hypothetical protein
MRSRDQDVVVVRRTINLGYWEFGMGREWGGVEKGEVSLLLGYAILPQILMETTPYRPKLTLPLSNPLLPNFLYPDQRKKG